MLVEVVQGEGGVRPCSAGYLAGLQQICHEQGALLIVDEVQTGMGRTGKFFAYQHYGIEPDIMTLAKMLGGGVAIGAMIAKKEIAARLTPGTHASTFGGNPLAARAAVAAIEAIEEDGLLENAARMGERMMAKLRDLAKRHPGIKEVRGKGLMIGIEIVKDPETKEKGIEERNKIIQACFEKGLLILGCGENVFRLIPPLIITQREADIALTILEEVLKEMKS